MFNCENEKRHTAAAGSGNVWVGSHITLYSLYCTVLYSSPPVRSVQDTVHCDVHSRGFVIILHPSSRAAVSGASLWCNKIYLYCLQSYASLQGVNSGQNTGKSGVLLRSI